MRWIVLALSLGATIVSLIHGVWAMGQLLNGPAGGASMTDFTWMTDILLLGSAIVAIIGGLLAFTRRKIGGVLLVMAALICFFAHSSFLYYGIVFLLAGLLSFLVRSRSEYGEDMDFDDDYDEDEEGLGGEEDDEEYEDGEEEYYDRGKRGKPARRGVFGVSQPAAKHKERPSKIHLDREEFSLSASERNAADNSLKNVPLGARKSKVCHHCGANVGIEHKFCYNCGKELHGPSLLNEEPESAAGSTVTHAASAASGFAEVSRQDGDDDLWRRGAEQRTAGRSGDFNEYAADTAYDTGVSYEDDEDQEEPDDYEAPSEVTSHRVFVKPKKENEEAFKAPISIDPDNSYQEFSNYTRRRKRRRSSLARRILGPLVLLLAVSGAAWLLFRGTSEVPNPTPPPAPISDPTPPPPPPPVVPEPTIWERLQVEAPSRGVVTGTNVNVRQDHSTATSIITKLNAGARADVAEQWEGVSGTLSGPWYRIRTANREGWIFGDYFQPLDARQTTLPEGYTDALLKSFGGGRAELTAQLGSPTRRTATTVSWSGLAAEAREEGGVTRLTLTGAQHVLQNEVAVGMAEDTLYRTIGYPSDYRSGQLRYLEGGAERGMAVRLQNKKVQSITVGNI